jgi:LDH2 family malate/lactate/ureidoglycolate dehydrogenase
MSKNDKYLKELKELGFSELEANYTFRVLQYAEKKGVKSHGFSLMKNIIKNIESGIIKTPLRLSRVVQSNGSVIIDCHNSIGYAAATIASRQSVFLAKKKGFSFILLNNIDHVGTLGYYTNFIAQRDCIGIMWGCGKPRIPLHGSKKPFLGTTPISIGIPNVSPLIIDTCFSKFTVNQLIQMSERNTVSEEIIGWDLSGEPTKDPSKALSGSLAPIGAHKGAAIAFALELMLTGFTGPKSKGNYPLCICAINISQINSFKKNISGVIDDALEIIKDNDGARLPGMNKDEFK